MDLELDAETKVMFIFVAFAVALGITIGLAGLNGYIVLLLGLLFFYVSYRISPEILDLEEADFEVSALNILKKGIIPYWFLLLVFWTLVFTLQF